MAQRQRRLRGTRGAYCAGPVMREKPANSALQCAGECSSDANCVAYSQRNSKCLLHADFCSSQYLLPEPGSLYVGEYLFLLHADCNGQQNCKVVMVVTVSGYITLLAA